jgi:hypothetical protein
MFKFAADPKSWISVTAPPVAFVGRDLGRVQRVARVPAFF